MDEGHVRSHWVGYSEKSPWLLEKKKKKIKGRDGSKETSLSSSTLFSSSTAASRLARPLENKVQRRIMGQNCTNCTLRRGQWCGTEKKKIIDTIYNWHLVRRLDFPTVINMPRFAAAPR